MSYARPNTLTVTVSGNTGTGTINLPAISGVRLRVISIDAPAAASYDWVVRDSDGYAMTGETGASGDETYYMDIPAKNSIVFTFVNASNGTYSIRVWDEYL